MSNKTSKKWLLALMLAGGTVALQAQQLAFPGAQGWGRYATGGRTGSVYHVTNLNDSGSGSLRDAVSSPNRIVVFDVAGVININSRIVFANNLYVAGQTAPGEGITVYGNGVSFSGASNTIVRYMRFRMGRKGDSGKDAAGISNGTNMIFDHCSFAWGQDETFSINSDGKGDLGNITIQNSVVGQGLMTHSAGGLMQADNITLYRNLYCDNSTRNNKVKGVNQYANNLVYNWKNGAYIMGGDSEGESFCNIQSNLFINGPAVGGDAFTGGNSNFHFYGNDNWQDRDRDGVFNPSEVTSYSAADRQSQPYAYPELELWAGNTLIDNLLPTVGASLPYRDYTDYYMIDEVMSFGKKGELISNEETLVYGAPSTWTVWKGNTRVDTDGDGMPDAWETANGTDPNKNDAMTIAANGYANIENYINSITEETVDFFLRAPMCLELIESKQQALQIGWRDYTRGETGFEVEIKGGAYADFTKVNTTEAGATTYLIDNLTEGTTYNVRMRAVDSKGHYSEYTPVTVMKTRPKQVEMVDVNNYQADNTWAAADGTWDNSTTAVWQEGKAFADGSKVLIDAATDTKVSIAGTVSPASVVVKGKGHVTLEGDGTIGGDGSLNKAGEGTLTVSTANAYKGATVVHEGVLEFNTLANGGENSAIGASDEFAQNWILDGGTYRYTGGSTSTNRSMMIYKESTFDIANASTTVTMTGSVEGAGNFVLDGKGKLSVATSKLFTMDGDVVLRGGNLYLSTTDISKAGIGTAGKLVMAGGTLSTKGEREGYETYDFPMQVEEGTTSIFAPNRNCYWTSTVTGSGNLQLNIPYLREYVQANFIQFTGRLIANGVGSDSNGSLLLINGKNIPNAVVEAKGNARVCAWPTNADVTLGGLSGTSGTYLMGSSKNTNGFSCTWRIGGANTNETFAGIINDWSCSGSKYTGTTNIVKQGYGDWRLTGTNTYKGKTTVDGGRLIVNGKNNGTGSYTVNEGATLAGQGTIGGAVVVNEGGTLHAGDTLINRLLIINGALTLKSGSVVEAPVTAQGNNKLSLKGNTTIGENVTLRLADNVFEQAPYDGTEYQVFVKSTSVTISGTFANIVPATPGEGQVWDTTELYTKGVLKVVGGEPKPGNPDEPDPGVDPQPAEKKTALLTWGNMKTSSYNGGSVNNMLVGVEGDDAEGFSMVVTGNLTKYYSAGDKITVVYNDQSLSRTTIKCSNGAENSVFLPEGARATKIDLWSYTNVATANRTSYWANVAGVDYTAENSTILAATKDTSNPNHVSFTLPKVENVVTFRNTGEQQCVIVALEYEVGGVNTGITTTSSNATPLSISYYDLSGKRLAQPQKGINLMRTTMSNGQVITVKVVR